MKTLKKLCTFFIITVFIFLSSCSNEVGDTPKYVFLFVGDGMGMNAVSLAEYNGESLAFTDFDSFSLISTSSLSSEITDSAASATAFSTGKKTLSGRVGVDKNGKKLSSLTDFFKGRGVKVGLVSSQAVNHATPAVFYAHNNSRYNYYEIGLDFCSSDIDLFAGAGFLEPEGGEGNLYDLSNGRILTNGKTALPFEIDRNDDEKSLAEYLSYTIDTLYSDNGFFIMCEGGRIDSAAHSNDAATLLYELRAFSSAVEVALDFYKKYPDDTLIIVTADHETGGLSLGYTETGYELYPEILDAQKISAAVFEKEYVSRYLETGETFENVLLDIEALFGLSSINEYERERLFHSYELTKNGVGEYTTFDHIEYSDKNPLVTEVVRILSRRAGLDFTTFYHTAAFVGLWAKGAGEENFIGCYDNTEIYYKIKNVCK